MVGSGGISSGMSRPGGMAERGQRKSQIVLPGISLIVGLVSFLGVFAVKTRAIGAKGDSVGKNGYNFMCFYECSGCHPKTEGMLRKVDFGQK